MHPRYVAQVLRDRGVQAPAVEQIGAYLRSLDPAGQSETHERIRKIAQGVDERDDVAALLEGIGSAARPPVTQEPKSTDRAAAATGQSTSKAADTRNSQTTALLRAHGMHVYAKSAALKIELDTLHTAYADATPRYTLQIEATRWHDGRFAWERKIPFQLTARELPVLASFLLGFAGSTLVFSNHGPNTDKRLEIEDQGGKLYVKLAYAGRSPIPVPVEAPDVFAWGELCLVALRLNRSMLDGEATVALLRRLGKMIGSR
jgi:hypothetical protein